MGVVSNKWLDRVLLSILCMFKPSRRPMFKPPSLGPPSGPLKNTCSETPLDRSSRGQLLVPRKHHKQNSKTHKRMGKHTKQELIIPRKGVPRLRREDGAHPGDQRGRADVGPHLEERDAQVRHRWNRNPRPQPRTFSKLVFLTSFC